MAAYKMVRARRPLRNAPMEEDAEPPTTPGRKYLDSSRSCVDFGKMGAAGAMIVFVKDWQSLQLDFYNSFGRHDRAFFPSRFGKISKHSFDSFPIFSFGSIDSYNMYSLYLLLLQYLKWFG
jgi:hypothetical protein